MKRALIVNAYAIGNRGDAAIVQGLIASLRNAGASHIAVAPRAWSAAASLWIDLGADEVVPSLVSIHDAPRWVRRPRPLLLGWTLARVAVALVLARHLRRDRAVAAYRDCDVVISAGGAYLGGPKVGINLIKVLNIAFGPRVGRPTLLAPMTVNPPGTAVRWLLRRGLRHTIIFVRDKPSQQRLREMGLRSALVPDLALRAPLVAAAASEVRNRSSGNYLCWAPRSYRRDQPAWKHRKALDERSAAAIAAMMRATGRPLRLIPQVTADPADDDRVAISRVRHMLPDELQGSVQVVDPASSLDEAVRQFAACNVMLTSRLHASLLAMAAGVPSMTIGYEPKVSGVLGGIGLGDRVVPPDAEWTAEWLADRLQALCQEPERRRTREALGRAKKGFEPLDAALVECLQQPSEANSKAAPS